MQQLLTLSEGKITYSRLLHDQDVAKVLMLPCRSKVSAAAWHRPRAFSAPNAADLASLKTHVHPELIRASEPIPTPDEPVHAIASDTELAPPADSDKTGRRIPSRLGFCKDMITALLNQDKRRLHTLSGLTPL